VSKPTGLLLFVFIDVAVPVDLHLVFLEGLVLEQTGPELLILVIFGLGLHHMHLDGAGQDLVRGVLGIDGLEELDIDLIILIAGLSLESEGSVGQIDGFFLHIWEWVRIVDECGETKSG